MKQQTDNRYQLALPPDFAVPAGPHTLPEGMRASPGGELTWNPTDEQFEALQEAPLPIRVAMQDQTYGDVLIASVDVLPAAPAKEEAPRASDPDNAVRLQFPRRSGWNVVREDEALNIKLSATGGLDQRYSYRVLNGEAVGLSYDTLGNVYWKPSYDVVDRLEESKKIPLIFEVRNQKRTARPAAAEPAGGPHQPPARDQRPEKILRAVRHRQHLPTGQRGRDH